tara:strand:- start:530 stop:2311 length:1782 start_codon:yes stop_codon:yes gene_type:complete
MSYQDIFYNSIPFDLNIAFSDKVSIDAVIDELLPKIKLPPKDNNKHLLKVLLLNVFANYHTATDSWTGFPKTRNYYNKKSRYNSNQVSKKIIEIMELLVSKKYLIFHGGYNSQNSYQNSYTSRIKASKKLVGIFYKHKMDNKKLGIRPDVELIIVKKKRGKNNFPIEYEDTPSIIVKRQLCKHYNNLLHRSHIDCVDVPDTGIFIGNSKYPIHVSQNNKLVKRILINHEDDDGSFLLYGRYHGGFWTQMNSEWRGKIKINGLDTVEIDFSGMGINILYDFANVKTDDVDPYNLEGYYDYNKYSVEELRPLLKQVLMVMTNSRSSVQALKALVKYVNNSDNKFPGDVNLKVLMNAFKKRHAPIKDYFFSNVGNFQYYIDSAVTSKIIDHFTHKQIVVLTVHDSYVIDINNADELYEVMIDSYMEIIRKHKKDIKVKIENKQYYKLRAFRSLKFPSNNPVQEMHNYSNTQWTSPDVTKMTKKDYHIDKDGRAWGIKRLFKDKKYKQRLLDWHSTGIHKVEGYYLANYFVPPEFLMDKFDEFDLNTLDRNDDNHLPMPEYYKKYPEHDYVAQKISLRPEYEEEIKQAEKNFKTLIT